jgi:DNA-binding transcriptional regulator YiaG
MDLLDQLLADANAQRSLPEPAVRRVVRQRAGLSQGDVARVLGVNRVSVTRWESGAREPRRSNAVSYAALLDRLVRRSSPDAEEVNTT